jgi:cation transport ATPase
MRQTDDSHHDHPGKQWHADEHKAGVAEYLRLALMALVIVASLTGWWRHWMSRDWLAFAATLIGGFPIYEEAWENLRKRRMTMELSMTIALVAALCIGQFLTALVIAFFVLFAEMIEGYTVGSGRRAIQTLIDALPRRVRVRRGGEERELGTNEVVAGETIIIRPGERIPADGVVIKGHSFVDQSSITGESLPVEKVEQSKVFAGTINKDGVLEVRIEKIGRDTTFGKIIEIVEQAEKSRAPVQRIADRLAAGLVYFAFGAAAFTLIVTRNFTSTIAVIIVAGACGVAAGTPLAILAGIGSAARRGIITKGGLYLEQLSRIDTIVLDKTGTLTLGIPEVTAVRSPSNIPSIRSEKRSCVAPTSASCRCTSIRNCVTRREKGSFVRNPAHASSLAPALFLKRMACRFRHTYFPKLTVVTALAKLLCWSGATKRFSVP